MSNILEMQHRLEQLRFADRVAMRLKQVKELTFSQTAQPFTETATDALIHLLEGTDILDTSKQVKFYSRTAYIGLLLSGGDDCSHSEDTLHSNLRSSLYYAQQICSNPEEFHDFLQSQKMSALLPYYQSAQHQQIQNNIRELFGPDFSMSTPYEFAQAVKSDVALDNFEKAVSCLIDFCLTLSQANSLSSQQIFVGCCLLICEKSASASLWSLLMSHFQSAMWNGAQLKEVIKHEIESTQATAA